MCKVQAINRPSRRIRVEVHYPPVHSHDPQAMPARYGQEVTTFETLKLIYRATKGIGELECPDVMCLERISQVEIRELFG